MFFTNKKAVKKRVRRLRFLVAFFCVSLATCVRASVRERPLLIDTSKCLLLTDALNVFPFENRDAYVLRTPVVVRSNSGMCTMRLIFGDHNMYPDPDPSTERITEYERHLHENPGYSENLWNEHMQDLEANIKNGGPHNTNFGAQRYQSLMVVSCDQEANTPKTLIPDTTDFSGVLQQPQGQTRIDVMKCYGSFCMLRITTQKCIRRIFEEDNGWPQTDRNFEKRATVMYSMFGLAFVMMKQRVKGLPKFGPDSGFSVSQIPGRNYKGLASHESQVQSLHIDYVCVMEANTPCSLEEATEYGEKLFLYWQVELHEGNTMSIIVFDGIEKSDDSTSNIFVMKMAMLPFHGSGDVLGIFIHDNMECPEHTVSTKNTNTMHEADGSTYQLGCTTCPIDSYYDKIVTPRPIVLKTQEMFILHWRIRDPLTRDMLDVQYITADIDRAIEESQYSNDIYKESVVDIGTTLILSTRLSGRQDDVNTTFVRMECENRTIQYDILNTTSISFTVSSEYAGKLILIHTLNSIDDTPLPPTYIFPRADDVSQVCITCPAGKFSGEYGVSGVSQCLDKSIPTTVADASGVSWSTEISTYDYMVNTDKVDFYKGNSSHFLTYIEIEDSYMKVIAIQAVSPQKPSSDFALQVWLESQDLELARREIVAMEAAVLKLYNANERIHISSITWAQDDFGRTLTVKRNTRIVVNSPPSHPFAISGINVWGGPAPNGVIIDDGDTHYGMLSFIVPETFTGKLYYYCFNHENMQRGEIILVDPPPRADDIYTMPTSIRLFSPEGSTRWQKS